MLNQIVCFKCEKELKKIWPDVPCENLPLISGGGFAKLEFGFGSKFDTVGMGVPCDVYEGILQNILSATDIHVPICDECFEQNLDKLIVFNKLTHIEYKKVQ